MERCSRDGCPAFEPEVEVEVEVEVVNEIVKSGIEGPWWARMGAGVPSCETWTPSYARCGDAPEDEDEDGDGDEGTSVLRYRADNARVEGWVVVSGDTDTDTRLDLKAEVRSCALRSTPNTILEPDGWVA
jgi:hypothetical protein